MFFASLSLFRVQGISIGGFQLNFRFEYDIEPYDELVIMKGLTIRIGERTLLEALDYVVHRGDKLIIAGPNGTGKSTMLQVLDGKRAPPAVWCGWALVPSPVSLCSSRPAAQAA